MRRRWRWTLAALLVGLVAAVAIWWAASGLPEWGVKIQVIRQGSPVRSASVKLRRFDPRTWQSVEIQTSWCAVRVHLHQRVEVPPEELSIRLGSYRARTWSTATMVSRSPETEGS